MEYFTQNENSCTSEDLKYIVHESYGPLFSYFELDSPGPILLLFLHSQHCTKWFTNKKYKRRAEIQIVQRGTHRKREESKKQCITTECINKIQPVLDLMEIMSSDVS